MSVFSMIAVKDSKVVQTCLVRMAASPVVLDLQHQNWRITYCQVFGVLPIFRGKYLYHRIILDSEEIKFEGKNERSKHFKKCLKFWQQCLWTVNSVFPIKTLNARLRCSRLMSCSSCRRIFYCLKCVKMISVGQSP